MKKSYLLFLLCVLVSIMVSCSKTGNPAAPAVETPAVAATSTSTFLPSVSATISVTPTASLTATLVYTLTGTLTATGTMTVTQTSTITETHTVSPTFTASPTATDIIKIDASFYRNDHYLFGKSCAVEVKVSRNGVQGNHASLVRLYDITGGVSDDITFSAGDNFYQNVSFAYSRYVPGNICRIEVSVDSVSYDAYAVLPGDINIGTYYPGSGLTVSCSYYGGTDTVTLQNTTTSVLKINEIETVSAQFSQPFLMDDNNFTQGDHFAAHYTAMDLIDNVSGSGAFAGSSAESLLTVRDYASKGFFAANPTLTNTPTYTFTATPTATLTFTATPTRTATATATPTFTCTMTQTESVEIQASFDRRDMWGTLSCSAAVTIKKDNVAGNYASAVRLIDVTQSLTYPLSYGSGAYTSLVDYNMFVPGNQYRLEAVIGGTTYSENLQAPGAVSISGYTQGAGINVSCGFYGGFDSVIFTNNTTSATVINSNEEIDGVFPEPYIIPDALITAGNEYTAGYSAINRKTAAFSGLAPVSVFAISDRAVRDLSVPLPTATITRTHTASPTSTRTVTSTATRTVTSTATATPTLTITPNVRGQINPPANMTPGVAYGIWLPVDQNFTSVLGEHYGTADSSLFSFGMYASTGSCYLQAWLDSDNSGGSNQGDFVMNLGATYPAFPAMPNVNVPSTSDNLYLSNWRTITTNDVTGALSGVVAEGKKFMVYVDGDTSIANGTYARNGGTCGSNITNTFTMFTGLTGAHYLFAWIDMDENGVINSGDYAGYYGGSGTNPPAAPNANLPGTGFNIVVNLI